MKRTSILILVMILCSFPLSAHINAQDHGVSINSESAILIDAKTGITLYEKNSRDIMYPASITKIVTAIVAIEEGKLDDIVVVSKNATNVEGTRVYLNEGEQVSMHKLVQGLLINSGNDAGVAIAEHMDGSEEAFSERMTRFVREKVGVEQTIFQNPHGLYDPDHFTTAYDMALITRYAMKNETFTKIMGTRSLPWEGESWETTIYNHHKLVRGEIPYEGVIGGKNGYVQKSGYTLVTVAEREKTQLIAVTLKASRKNDAYKDTIKLLDYGFENFDTSLLPKPKQNSKNDQKDREPILEKKGISMEKESLEPVEKESVNDHNLINFLVTLALVEMFVISLIVKIRKNNLHKV
ncbi:D-alanyl-D-alanine carboxypeptidase family protein [Bacillus salitolerans]|uniref:D-alanyl-D-alanine carboxypeptidase family protein n=1 Tax=Bacillus salitolerans TaxID=1437434 RepID=A0ABW4LX25_9BACI